jgi:hypothetical protein
VDFEDLYRITYPRVLAYARSMASREDADDAVAEAYAIAWRKQREIPRGAELGWLIGVTRRVLANTRRSGRRAGAARALGITAAAFRMRSARARRRLRARPHPHCEQGATPSASRRRPVTRAPSPPATTTGSTSIGVALSLLRARSGPRSDRTQVIRSG